jgi:1-deoxy-D-xylulose-5-phosphate reductoisomerase
MIEYEDGAVVAQLASPDMREPIQLALGFPERMPLNNKKLDFAALGSISFFEPDLDKFPCLGLAYKAIEKGGNIPCVMNAANESAVAAFLHDRIAFYDIPKVIERCMDEARYIENPTLDDIFMINDEVRRSADEMIEKMER